MQFSVAESKATSTLHSIHPIEYLREDSRCSKPVCLYDILKNFQQFLFI